MSGEFAPPRVPIRPEPSLLRRAWWFVVRRGLRLLVGPLVLTVCVTLVFGVEDPWRVGAIWATGVLMWFPATLVQFRVAFFPSPPDPWLPSDDGPLSAVDLRAVYRSEVAEFVLGSIPPLCLAVWFATHPGIPTGSGWLVALALSLILVARDLQVLTALALQEASLDLAAGEARRARWWLENLLRWPIPGTGDRARLLLAQARFQSGDRDGALSALDRVRRPDRWHVETIRAQMAIGRDGTGPARAAADRLRTDPRLVPLAEAITALVQLHEDRADEVVARADVLLALPPGETRGLALLLLAAALAPTEPERARRLLADARWDPRRAAAVVRPWPPVAERLAALDAPR